MRALTKLNAASVPARHFAHVAASRVSQSLQLGSGPSRAQKQHRRVTPRPSGAMAATSAAAPAAGLPKMQRKSPTEIRAMDFEPVDAKTREQSGAIVDGVKSGGEAALIDFATKFGDLKPGERGCAAMLRRTVHAESQRQQMAASDGLGTTFLAFPGNAAAPSLAAPRGVASLASSTHCLGLHLGVGGVGTQRSETGLA